MHCGRDDIGMRSAVDLVRGMWGSWSCCEYSQEAVFVAA